MLKITIISKEKVVSQGEAEAIFVPTQAGLIEVLPEHMQLVSALQAGEILVKKHGKDEKFKVSGGVLEVRKGNNVIILVDIKKE